MKKKKKLTQEKFTLVLANCGFVTRPNGNLPFRFFNHVSRIKEVSLDLFETHFLDSLLLDHVVELKKKICQDIVKLGNKDLYRSLQNCSLKSNVLLCVNLRSE